MPEQKSDYKKFSQGLSVGCHSARETRCQEKQSWQIKRGGVLQMPFQARFEDNFSSFHNLFLLEIGNWLKNKGWGEAS